MSETIVITDTSVLVNFLVLDEVRLLTSLPHRRFLVTEHVRTEVKQHYEQQLQRLEHALASNQLEEIRITDVREVQLFAELTASGLGVGESSAIAVAAERRLHLAIDDKRAVKKMKKLGLHLPVFSTAMLVVELIRHAKLSVLQADAMKLEWEQNHRFRLTFGSFAERL